MEKSTQFFTIVKYQKKAFSVLSKSNIDWFSYKVYKKDEDYYPQVFLEECKYAFKEKRSKFITDDIEISSDDSHIKNPDEENSNEEI